MGLIILNVLEVIEGLVGSIILGFLEYKLHKGRRKWFNAKAAAIAFFGAWCARKFVVHIYYFMGGDAAEEMGKT